MSETRGDFRPFESLMQQEDNPSRIVIDTFAAYYEQLVAKETGTIAEAGIRGVDHLPNMENLPADLDGIGREALGQTVLLKLNGGLGTGMGLDRAKSLLTVKDGLSMLDIIAKQAMDKDIPLVLMNSFSTETDTREALAKYDNLSKDLDLDFRQNRVPKILAADLTPAKWPADPSHEWCPPGHGDIYTALITTGMLDRMLAGNYRYAFISNSDNLGAVVDELLLGYFVKNELPFMMEVADRTEADKKGGHLARRLDGQLILRESAQCAPQDEASFQDIGKYKYFNTNNLWIDLKALKALMEAKGNILGLTMIRNEKTIDPKDATSPKVYQLETAMGAAIEIFKGSGAVRVPTSRFAPIKSCNDLLDVRSDNYILDEQFRVRANPARRLGRAFIDLDSAHYKMVADFEARFPHGPPSLLDCARLVVRGDIVFGKDVVLEGNVEIDQLQLTIPDGELIRG